MSERSRWTLDDGRRLLLLTPEEWAALPDGTKVVSILGEEKVRGEDEIDLDTRGGLLAYGVEEASYGTADTEQERAFWQITDLDEQAKRIRELPENWNSYGSARIDERALDAALALARAFRLVPSSTGGVEVTSEGHGIDVSVEFRPDGSVESFFFADDRDKT